MILGALASATSMGLLATGGGATRPGRLPAGDGDGRGRIQPAVPQRLEVITGAAPAHHRGGVLSALYLLAYLSMGSVALVLGAVATARGLALAVDLGAGVIAGLSLGTLALAALMRGIVSRSSH